MTEIPLTLGGGGRIGTPLADESQEAPVNRRLLIAGSAVVAVVVVVVLLATALGGGGGGGLGY